MKIQVLGTGCMKCNKLYAEVEKAIAQVGVSAELSKVEKIEEIVKFGAAFTPGLVIDGEVKIQGKVPKLEQIAAWINEAANKRKITFAPSSSDIESDAMETIDAIAGILRDCQSVQIEISGHTDSQGREIMNEQLSQARADSVLNAIMARRVLTSNLSAKGYGESQPIADNDTEGGREANRRIEFRLVAPEAEADDAGETTEATGAEDSQ